MIDAVLNDAVHKAGQLGLRLVLPLVNNWPHYGGMRQYVSWFLELPDDSYGEGTNHDHFYTDTNCKKAYRAWAKHVIGRRNRYTGLRCDTDPTTPLRHSAGRHRRVGSRATTARCGRRGRRLRWPRRPGPGWRWLRQSRGGRRRWHA